MLRVLEHFNSEPRACAYLPAETASLEYKIMLGVGQDELDGLLARGWRRFGVAYFRPACSSCSQCVPLRVPVEHFEPARNQRRSLARGENFRMKIGSPTIDPQRIELYRAWHSVRTDRRGWADDQMDAERYFHEFAFPHPAVRELSFWDGDKLIAVSIVDETQSALSAVYTYHDPTYEKVSLGTLSVLRQIQLAKKAGKKWVYLGYRVMGCQSSEYKARFQPHELLQGWPGASDTPVWLPG